MYQTDLPIWNPTHLARDYHRPGWATFLRPSAACLIQVWVTDSVSSDRSPPSPCVLSITRLGRIVISPVREYQPVVHRLRLSASPSVPTYPGRISLPQEPLVIRRRGFSPLFRYSCLHSHSSGVHSWVTPLLLSPPDAPLPIRAPGP